ILTAAQRADSDMVYAILSKMDGRCVASTDPTLRNVLLTRDAFEATVLSVNDFVQRETPRRGVFEVLMPVRSGGAPLGVLRIGISRAQISFVVRQALWAFFLSGGLALLFGIAVYVYVAQRVAAPLLEVVTRLQDLARGTADLTLRLPISTKDEVGL